MNNEMIDSRQNVKSLSLHAVPRYRGLELMLSPSIKYDFTIITTSNYDIDPIKNNTYFTS